MSEIIADGWFKCYGQAWGNLCCPTAVAPHPAKFSRKLIFRIFEHAIEEGWVKPGDTCLDCFGGIALGALPAQLNSLHWVGVELEDRFVQLGQQNIDLWNSRYAEQMPNWGTAIIVQGDSRRLGEVLAEARLCLSSPPYGGNVKSDRTHERRDERRLGADFTGRGRGCFRGSECYGQTEGNLGNLPDTGFEAALAVSSPVYAAGCTHTGGDDPQPGHIQGGKVRHVDYGQQPGQLAQMPEGDLALAISSPPFLAQSGGTNVTAANGPLADVSLLKRHSAGNQAAVAYGESNGQLATLPEGDHAAALEAGPLYAGCLDNPAQRRDYTGTGGPIDSRVGCEEALETGAETGRAELCLSSPPFEQSLTNKAKASDAASHGMRADRTRRGGSIVTGDYGSSEGQLGQQQGSTFWAASREILEEVYKVLAPGGHAIWVLKMFVRSGQLVDFPGQWEALCQSVGFKTVCKHRAWLSKNAGIMQATLDGNEISMEKWFKSFFRRLCENKGSPRIDWELVLCMVKE